MSQAKNINAAAWAIWFVGASAVPLISRHPLYLILNALAVSVVYLTAPHANQPGNAWKLFAYIGSGAAGLSIAFNVLTVHSGDRVFAALPGWLPIIGGNLTMNALVYGGASAIAISSLLFAAATFNSVVRHSDLIRLLPASIRRLGVAGSIALAFVPQTISAGRDIYDAQRSRGHRFRGVRDARGFILPLLATGMERALNLSQALETRGFGASKVQPKPGARQSISIALSVALLLVALFCLASGRLLIASIALLGALSGFVFTTPAAVRRSRYRPLTWNLASLLTAIFGLGPFVIVIIQIAFTPLLTFEPFPRLDSLEFNPLAGVAILGLLLPAIISPRS